ncbi:prepilin-type N-terminal cleavage/methylation domain-containing protein [Demequina capsici]|uniref:Prepilin-type N-terminal cleavage/methylation domain-containing protein n=1 Tax=Demequina capsici TaxID=3075620 RepID=A0AA96FEK8_9MICO|nr:prepilin-type N-terminal cleavage/methylation domain-containing protein [Demequina sp. PMTSA13]WNM28668.1 prepilin-type N-terminal cleavage/methylation domain-containing protein [Demequina sp. PMTSA13]
MIARIRKSIENKDQGFTLIELLVVMIIIGILAAIAIPIFLNQRKKAEDSAAKADVSTLGKEVATWWVDGTVAPTIAVNANGSYMIGTAGDMTTVGQASNNVVFDGISTLPAGGTMTGTNWCVAVHNDSGDKTTAASGGASYSAAGGLQIGADAAC